MDTNFTSNATAYRTGWADGSTIANEQTTDQVEYRCDRAGFELPDEALINASTVDDLTEFLGLTEEQIREHGMDWHIALESYNHGWFDGFDGEKSVLANIDSR